MIKQCFSHHHPHSLQGAPQHAVQAPEINGDGAVAAILVLAMVLAILTGRRA
jgi:hypothetical protein